MPRYDAQLAGESHGVVLILDHVLRELDGLAIAFEPLFTTHAAEVIRSRDQLDKFLAERAPRASTSPNMVAYQITTDIATEYDGLFRVHLRASATRYSVPRAMLLALVGHFDAFLARLICELLKCRPELLKGLGESRRLDYIFAFESIEDLQAAVAFDKAESIMRVSHLEQLRGLDKLFSIETERVMGNLLSTFVELTERRNLCAHTGGVVSTQYLGKCQVNKVPADPLPKLGEVLDVHPDYFETAYMCLYESAVRLTHVLWRSIRPDEMAKSEENLCNITLGLIDNGRYDMAVGLLHFALALEKHANEGVPALYLLNLAQAYKWKGDRAGYDDAMKRLGELKCAKEIELGAMVLRDEFADASALICSLGPDSSVQPYHYERWPIFREFRKSEEFAVAFEQVFGRKFTREVTEAELTVVIRSCH